MPVVMMLLNHRLLRLIKGNRYKGLPLSYVQRFSKQVRCLICSVVCGANLICSYGGMKVLCFFVDIACIDCDERCWDHSL